MNRAAEKDFASLFRLPKPHSRLESISSIITISSVFTAAVLTAILYLTFLLEDVNHEYSLLAATFFLGVSVYKRQKVTDVKEDSINLPDRTRFVKNHRTSLLFVSLESLSIAIVFAFFSNPYAILLIVFCRPFFPVPHRFSSQLALCVLVHPSLYESECGNKQIRRFTCGRRVDFTRSICATVFFGLADVLIQLTANEGALV